MLNNNHIVADFSYIRYAQCWEDADILLQGLDIKPHHVCLSIASAGDNTLAMLSCQPARVIALDLNPAQLFCLELRVAAYRELRHHEMLELIGSRPSTRCEVLYRRCRRALSSDSRRFWDRHTAVIAGGIGRLGKFERYMAFWQTRILPLIHSRDRITRLFQDHALADRRAFYRSTLR